MQLSRFSNRFLTCAVLSFILVALASCAGTSNQTEFMKRQENVTFSANELRVRLYDFAANFSGAVEQTADDIIAGTDDPVIRRRAIQWKSSATAKVYSAAFGHDPLGAFTDVWAFSKQMLHFFETGAGSELFGDRQPEVLATARILERNIHALAQSGTVSGDASELDALLDQWAEERPLNDLQFIRESTTPFWAEFISSKGGGMAVIGRMEDSLMDMVARLDILAENLRKQAVWETELMLDEAMSTGEFGQFLARVDTIDVNIDRIRLVLDDLEPILSRQIQALMVTGGELTERERELAKEFWAIEREIMFARIEAIQSDVFDRLAVERALIMREIEASADKTVGQTLERTRSLIDHLVWRLAQLAAGILFLAGLLVLMVYRLRNRTT